MFRVRSPAMSSRTEKRGQLLELLDFLSRKYGVDRSQLFLEYSSRSPPSLKGGGEGYYDGLLSYRKKNNRSEFLITVFSVSRDPLLTLAHEFAHLVENLRSGDYDKQLQPPNNSAEKELDSKARTDLAEFMISRRSSTSRSEPQSP